MTVRVRFAPSPTGQVHIGNIRAAIFNWLFARHEGGKFLLRIEDTDRERSTPEAVKTLLDAMEWLGLNWDEEPMYQSARIAAHLAAAEELLRKGLARKEDKGGTGKGECVIFAMPREDASFHDLIKGVLTKEAKDVTDFVIVRSDGAPVFHLANVVDDIEMKTTHVIRGDDHIENTYRHVALFRALGAEPPRYAHLPMIVNQQGKPYSKRDGAAFVGEFRDRGFHPDALFNYLALLGWSPGGDREKMTRAEMIELFTLDRIKSGPAQMDPTKLTHMNSQYLAELPADTFAREARRAIGDRDWLRAANEDYFRKVAALLQSRTSVYPDAEGWKYFFSDEIDYDEKAVQKGLKKEGIGDALAALTERLQAVEFTAPEIEKAMHEVEAARGIEAGKLNFPVRVAVTGVSKGAGIYETMAVLGKERALRRLGQAAQGMCG